VQRVARFYLHPDRLTIVLVGDASAFVKQLPGAGFDKFEVIPAADLDLFSPDLRKKTPVSRDRVRPVVYVEPLMRAQPGAAKALLNKAIAAKGGLAKLQGIRTVRAEGTMVALSGAPFPVVTSIEYPDRFRIDADMPGGTVVQVFADGRFWIQDASGVRDAPAAARGATEAPIQRDIVRVLLKAASGALVVREVDSDDPLLGAIEVGGDGMPPLTLFINRDNGLIEKARYMEAQGRSEESYSDYRNVNGIQVPFHTVVRRAGAPAIERDVKTIHYNVPLPPGLFVRPSGLSSLNEDHQLIPGA